MLALVVAGLRAKQRHYLFRRQYGHGHALTVPFQQRPNVLTNDGKFRVRTARAENIGTARPANICEGSVLCVFALNMLTETKALPLSQDAKAL